MAMKRAMRLAITVSLQHYLDRRLDCALVWDRPGVTTFELAALAGLAQVNDLTAEADGKPLPIQMSDAASAIEGPDSCIICGVAV
ncbi:MAG: hypothetical protein IPK17_36755 [Chloroflexi bacterium]|uniref:hypothetical protein n=1 Tax=Candidatus Flexifilum breve TaxID=3140694 RepID=UPI003135A532|nr:hypothetical protein [Chloroflexota bacterium]